MQRTLPLLAVLVLAGVLAAGCGGGGSGGETSTTAARAPADPGLAAVRRVIAATRAQDVPALWNLLSTPSKRRLGPTLAGFRARSAPAVMQQLRYFASHPYREIVSGLVTGRFGVVAIASGKRAFAVPLRREGKDWKLQLRLGRGKLWVDPLGPQPGSVGRVGQVAFEIHGSGTATAVLFTDGRALPAREYSGPHSETIYANLDSPLEPGLHNAVAFATRGSEAADATAWTFLAR